MFAAFHPDPWPDRGHTVEAVKSCFRLSKNAGFKMVAHMMPDLPNVGWERDIECFREFFENPDFRTDGLKLYPTLVIRGTGLYELWKKGIYRNYSPEKLIDLVARQEGSLAVLFLSFPCSPLLIAFTPLLLTPSPSLPSGLQPDVTSLLLLPSPQDSCPGAPVGPHLPHPAGHPDASRHLGGGEGQPARARSCPHGRAGPQVPG